MHKTLLSLALAASTLAGLPQAQAAQDGPWMVRARVVHMDSRNGDSTGLGLAINNKTIPDVDISYFFSPNLAAELLLTVPQKHQVTASGTPIGSLRHLPPTLLLQYHFDVAGVRPYVGAGVNYTRFSSVNLLGGAATIESHSWGPAVQVGVDIPLQNQLYFNLDLKKVHIRTDVYASGAKAGSFKADPLLLGVGLGWRF